MADLREIQELAAKTAPQGVPELVQEKYNDGLKYVGKKLWKGWLQVAASGFGKGLILTALAIIGATAVAVGIDAVAQNALFETGFMEGMGRAVNFLWSGMGLVTLGVGGTLGAVADARKAQNQLTAQEAMVEARQLERIRALHQAQQPSVSATRPVAVPHVPFPHEPNGEKCLAGDKTFGFCAREAERRAEALKTNFGISS